MNHTSLGQRIRMARKEQGLTQHDLAQGIVTSSMICQIENGKAFPSYHVLSSLAERLGKPIEFFVSDTDATKRLRSSYTLAKALMEAGSYEKAYSLLKSIEDAHVTDPDEFHLTLSECCRKLGKYEEATLPLDTMLTEAQHHGQHKRAFTLLVRLGDIAETSGQHQLALYRWHKAYDLLEKIEVDPMEKNRLLTSMGVTYYKLEAVEEALTYLQIAYNQRETFVSLEELGQMYLMLSLSYRDKNDYAQASYFSDQAYTIFKSMTNRRMSTDVKRSLAVLLSKQGQFDEAMNLLHECLCEYEQQHDPFHIGLARLELAAVLHHAGHLTDAIAQMNDALPLLAHDELESARAHRLLADLHHAQRDLEGAIAHLNRSVQLYQKQGDSVGMVEAMNLSVALFKEWDQVTQHRMGAGATA